MKNRFWLCAVVPILLLVFSVAGVCDAAVVGDQRILAQRERIERLMSASVRQRAITALNGLRPKILSAGSSAELRGMASAEIRTLFPSGTPSDIETLVAYVLGQAYLEEIEDLRQMVGEMNRMNEAKRKMREYIAALKDMKRQVDGKIRSEYSSLPPVRKPRRNVAFQQSQTSHFKFKFPSTLQARVLNAKTIPSGALDGEIKKAEEEMDTLGDMSEEMAIKLQKVMDKKTQAEDTLLNIMKVMEKTQDNIISNLK